MNVFEVLKGGSFALFIRENKPHYYYAENSWYLVDDWNFEIENGEYFELIKKHKVEYSLLESAIELLKNKYEQNLWAKKLNWKLPTLTINFDKKRLISNYFDQALENRVPTNWEGKYISNKEEFLNLIPNEFKYWNSINLHQ